MEEHVRCHFRLGCERCEHASAGIHGDRNLQRQVNNAARQSARDDWTACQFHFLAMASRRKTWPKAAPHFSPASSTLVTKYGVCESEIGTSSTGRTEYRREQNGSSGFGGRTYIHICIYVYMPVCMLHTYLERFIP